MSGKKMGLTGLTTLVAVNMMGSGIIMLPSSMAQLGAESLLSWAITALGSMAIAYCFAQCGIYCTRPGGMSAYTEEAHGKSAFFLFLLSLAIGNVASAISAVGYLTPFLPWLGSGAIPCADVQWLDRRHHHGPGGDGLGRLAAGMAVHPGADRQGHLRAAGVSAPVRPCDPAWQRRCSA
jgi:amino acid transporter